MSAQTFDLETEIARTVKRIQEMATGGFAPSVNEYDDQCTGGAYRRSGYFAPRNISWSDLVRRAGLVSKPRGKIAGKIYGHPDSVPDAVEAEIRKIFEWKRSPEREIGHRRAAGLPDEDAKEIEAAFATNEPGWPMYAIPTRKEERIVALGDGTVWKVTRYCASIR